LNADEPTLLHEFFLRAAARWSANLAIDVPPRDDRPRSTRTYAELLARAEAIAAALQAFPPSERVVAILVDRHDPDLFAAQIAAHLAGHAFLSLEPSLPDERLRLLIADSAAEMVAFSRTCEARARAIAPPNVTLLPLPAELSAVRSASPPRDSVAESSLAYLIYTSGTTGRPKGVMIEHRSIAALVRGDLEEFVLGPGDRVAQGSSAAYDSSIEETWLALASGATLVVVDDPTIRLGPDLLPWLRQESITVLCPPPTLLRTLGSRDPARDLPALRLLYVGGEPLPPDIARDWAPGRRLVNGYGPTECTVTVVRADITADSPICIGRAVPGSEALVLDERLRPVEHGDSGELCIRGRSLARGYRGDPELTARRFVEHPELGRIYRTGDRVREDGSGTLYYEGRLDDQVKLRGHRIELGEIEACLREIPGVAHSACKVDAGHRLLAFVVLDGDASRFDEAAVRESLRARLPAVMVPTRILAIAQLPTTIGGKLDRKRLPDPEVPPQAAAAPHATASPRETRFLAAFRDALGHSSMDVETDFFDAGGDSVRAALLISRLRDDPASAYLSVRDLYEARTPRALAARPRADHGVTRAPRSSPADDAAALAVAIAQGAWIFAEAWLFGVLAWWLACTGLPWLLTLLPPLAALFLLPPLFVVGRLALGVLALALVVCAKRWLIGSYRECEVVANSAAGFRHWLVAHLAQWVPWGTLTLTSLQVVALRWLGARIGRNVHIHRGVDLTRGGWDLLEIGDDVTLNQDAALRVVMLERSRYVYRPIRIGDGATLEVRAGVDGGGVMAPQSRLTALSSLSSGSTVGAGEEWHGVPARSRRPNPEPARLDRPSLPLPPVGHAIALLTLRALFTWLAAVPALLAAAVLLSWFDVESATVTDWIAQPTFGPGMWWLLTSIPLAVAASLLLLAFALRLGPKVPTGTIGRRSLRHVIALLRTRAVETAGEWLSGTMFWPSWLRLAGARIGKGCEISTIIDVLPEHLTIGAHSFFADGIYLGGGVVDRGRVTHASVRLGSDVFLGNHSVIPAGSTLADSILLGVATVADDSRMRTRTAWFGHPAFELPAREIVTMDRRLTHDPSLVRVVSRAIWELARLTIPCVGALAIAAWWSWSSNSPTWLVGGVGIAIGGSILLLVITIKWLLLGRMREGQHPLWSCWCSRWDFLFVFWRRLAAPLVSPLTGTAWLHVFLRMTGVRIGRRVLLGPGFAQVVDPDMIRIDDDATVDTHFQAHSFEDRVLKLAPLRIERGASVMHDSVVLYGSNIGSGARVLPGAVVMKNERLAAELDHRGAPTRSGSDSHERTDHVDHARDRDRMRMA
jgi:non-ribosomal peptide synthetase-like protein